MKIILLVSTYLLQTALSDPLPLPLPLHMGVYSSGNAFRFGLTLLRMQMGKIVYIYHWDRIRAQIEIAHSGLEPGPGRAEKKATDKEAGDRTKGGGQSSVSPSPGV